MPDLKEKLTALLARDRRDIYLYSLNSRHHFPPGITNLDHYQKSSFLRKHQLPHQQPDSPPITETNIEI